MSANTLTKYFDRLSPEERFRLILAAGARGDEAEQERLCQSAQLLTLRYLDHAPWAQSFDQLATQVFLELLEEVAKHRDAFERWCDVTDDDNENREGDANEWDEVEIEEDPGEGDETESADTARTAIASEEEERKQSLWERMLALYYAQGFILKTKIAGWQLFCERWTIPAFAFWKLLPGFERLQSAIEFVVENKYGAPPAFSPRAMVDWLNRIRPNKMRKITLAQLLSPAHFADDLENAFRELVEWRGG